MTPELIVLLLAALLAVVQLGWNAVRANLEMGPAWFLTPRDDAPPQPLSTGLGRLKRAYENHMETLPLFAIAAIVVTLAGASSGLTVACAWIYLGARVLFVPAYRFGWMPWRSAIWAAGFAATVLMLLAALI
ncbi:MAG: MAPEG family protein [Alkalilacustris sp.]